MRSQNKKLLEKSKKELQQGNILKPLNIDMIGSNDDPCFGKEYDLSTEECKICGDSELCCIKFASLMGKTRKELEENNKYKDLEVNIDIKSLKRDIRIAKRKGDLKKDIIDKIQSKYELTREEARMLYKKYSTTKKSE